MFNNPNTSQKESLVSDSVSNEHTGNFIFQAISTREIIQSLVRNRTKLQSFPWLSILFIRNLRS